MTFDDADIMYRLIGFAGAEDSAVVPDPTNPANRVGRSTRADDAEVWAGTVIATRPNDAVGRIGFDVGDTRMRLRVWSPRAGVRVRLKVEDATNPEVSVETEAQVTRFGAWEALAFDFAEPVAGTPGIDFDATYDKVVVFFDFGSPPVICEPMCAGRACGSDGCGGECGPGCGADEVCVDGACERAGCEPMCAGRACGPDGCGGECGPGCDGDAVCVDGQCAQEGCPGGTFECGGVCADLLNDPENCGSCGTRCAARWPEALVDAGIDLQAANIEAVCAQAECAFVCGEAPQVVPEQLVDDVNNCGACGNRCAGAAINSIADACASGRCRCVLTNRMGQPLDGEVCGDWCQLDGAVNCANGCCPDMPAQTRVDAGGVHQFTFEVDGLDTVRFDTRCAQGEGGLWRYDDDGVTDLIGGLICGQISTLPILRTGRYGVRFESIGGPADIGFERAAPLPDFVVPGRHVRETVGRLVYAVMRVPAGGEHAIRVREHLGDGNCGGAVSARLLDMNGAVVADLADIEECRPTLRVDWEGRLAAGTYVVEIRGGQRGSYVFEAQRTDVEVVIPDGAISRVGVFRFDGFARNGSATFQLFFPLGGRFNLVTLGPRGAGCPGDTILTVRRGARQVAQNDDSPEAEGGCSHLTYDFDAQVLYDVVITGYEDGAVPDGALGIYE